MMCWGVIEKDADMGRASRRKKAERRTRSQSAICGPWGFDYGVSARAAAVGSIDFNEKLREAAVFGVVYGSEYCEEVAAAIPALLLVGRNEAPFQEAFKEFNSWATASDGDAVDLTIVFGKHNGYTLIIGADTERLMARVLRYDAIVEPLSFQVSWVKPIDTVSQPLKEIRAFLQGGIRAFIFSAATYSGLTAPGTFMPELLRPVRGIKKLLKFIVRFVDEGSEQDKRWQEIARSTKDRKSKSKKSMRLTRALDFLDAETVFTSRSRRLKTLFPVSLWRAESCDNIRSTIGEAEKVGIRQWQVQQALCNVLVSREIATGAPHFAGITESEWPDALINRLRARYELGNGELEAIKQIKVDEILQQTLLDRGYLLNAYGVKPVPTELVPGQNALKRFGLLDSHPSK